MTHSESVTFVLRLVRGWGLLEHPPENATIKFQVTLTPDERLELRSLIASGTAAGEVGVDLGHGEDSQSNRSPAEINPSGLPA